MKYKTITFYKYTELENPEQFREYFRGLCEGLNLLGRIIIAEEARSRITIANLNAENQLKDAAHARERLFPRGV